MQGKHNLNYTFFLSYTHIVFNIKRSHHSVLLHAKCSYLLCMASIVTFAPHAAAAVSGDPGGQKGTIYYQYTSSGSHNTWQKRGVIVAVAFSSFATNDPFSQETRVGD